jgi:UMF1 family MFS transporter
MSLYNHKKIINAWCMYDWANSAFYTTVMAAVLPIFFRQIAAADLSQTQHHLATSLWGYTTSIAMIGVAVLSLIFGPVSDYTASKKRFLAIFTGCGAVATSLLALTGQGDWIWVSCLFILANISCAGGEVFYNGLLPHITRPGEIDRISTRGYALGYIGGGLLLAVNIGMIYFLPKTTLTSGKTAPLLGMQLSFLSVGIWWFIFSTPLFRHVPEPPGVKREIIGENPVKISIQRLSATFHEIRKYKQLFLLLVAFWFYNDGIGTIIKMATAYGDEIGIGTLDLIGALLLVQFVGIPFSLLFGRIAGWIGTKKAILLGLGIYTSICIGGYFMTKAIHFWILAFMVGLVQGGTQGLSRSLYGSIIPKTKSAEFFSFYNISGKFAGIVGPAVFGLISQLTRNSRLGILSLVFFFIAGGIILTRVDVEKGRAFSATE